MNELTLPHWYVRCFGFPCNIHRLAFTIRRHVHVYLRITITNCIHRHLHVPADLRRLSHHNHRVPAIFCFCCPDDLITRLVFCRTIYLSLKLRRFPYALYDPDFDSEFHAGVF